MSQNSFDFPLTEFEQITADTHICFKISNKEGESEEELNNRVDQKMASKPFKDEVRLMVSRWNSKRVKLGLKPWV